MEVFINLSLLGIIQIGPNGETVMEMLQKIVTLSPMLLFASLAVNIFLFSLYIVTRNTEQLFRKRGRAIITLMEESTKLGWLPHIGFDILDNTATIIVKGTEGDPIRALQANLDKDQQWHVIHK